jgi:hypothetical protein
MAHDIPSTFGLLRTRNKPMNPRTEWSWRRAQVNAFGMALEVVNA